MISVLGMVNFVRNVFAPDVAGILILSTPGSPHEKRGRQDRLQARKIDALVPESNSLQMITPHKVTLSDGRLAADKG